MPGLFDNSAGFTLVERITRRAFRALIRSVVFIAGMVGGCAIALVVLSFGGSASTDFMGVFFGFGLMLAAPRCWIAAVWHRKGDYWTLGYVGAWLVFVGLSYGLHFMEEGKPIRGSNHAPYVAFGLLAALYLLVLPVGVIVYRRRT